MPPSSPLGPVEAVLLLVAVCFAAVVLGGWLYMLGLLVRNAWRWWGIGR